MINFIIVTHGEFGAYLVEAAEGIVGRQAEGVRVVPTSSRQSIGEIRQRVEHALDTASICAVGRHGLTSGFVSGRSPDRMRAGTRPGRGSAESRLFFITSTNTGCNSAMG